MGISKEWNIEIGRMPKGSKNMISDVPGVLVGHCTVEEGCARTGVTALLPHQGNLFREKVMAAGYVLNGFGKTIGLVQVEELGTIETPILLTNTFGVGTVSNALIKYMMDMNPEIGVTTGTVNPLVCECNDGNINRIREFYVKEEHAFQALAACKDEFEEGAVGAGRGMICHGCKGGIGSSSRLVELDGDTFTIGALVLTNHALRSDLTVGGIRIDSEKIPEGPDKGSVITILATDIPLSERQLKRLCKRTAVGLSHTGSYMMNGSGEIAVAFTTANKVMHFAEQSIHSYRMIQDEAMDICFRAAAESVEEAVISSLLHAGGDYSRTGKWIPSLTELL